MFKVLSNWYHRTFTDPEAVAMALVLLIGFTLIYFMGDLLAPLLIALVLAYLLDWPVSFLANHGFRRGLASALVLLVFFLIATFAVLRILPTVWGQGVNLLSEYPVMLNSSQQWLESLPQRYPEFIDGALIEAVVSNVRSRLMGVGEQLLQSSFSSIVNLATVMVYSVLVPLMVFFMLSDKKTLLGSVSRFLPNDRRLIVQVWAEMNGQVVNYIRGKAIEILVVGCISYVVFAVMDLRYSALLAVLVGLSVLIPFIGAFAVTLPVAMVGLFQWGVSPQFGYLILAYGVIQVIDGNVLVPLLFSEAVNLHPLAIIMAVLVFGGLWGFWGVFFAIPLATLVKAVINAWPHHNAQPEEQSPQA
ncbi:AI-2E family transporter [Agarivorans gilvus]|jgi:putative permease|uniref:AI-2E family transporter n=1 Tax=Agarivorans gilvus TaxID=680279 RepID=A0ABQ1I4W8_9ALTE|nr:AI-2E family transporter [Agarivorans gilvus]GGB09274.1 AI-2E family transporter [Agarivorans gilvus]